MNAIPEEDILQGLLKEQVVTVEALEDVLKRHAPEGGQDALVTQLAAKRIAPEPKLWAYVKDPPGTDVNATLGMPPPQKIAPPAPPRYLRLVFLGQGSSGSVWMAYDLKTRSRVVLKFLAPAGQDPLLETRGAVRLWSRVTHPGIVPIVETGDFPLPDGKKAAFLATQYIDGSLLEKANLTLERGLRLMRDAAQAIHHAHLHGLAHGNIKPRNLILRRDGQVAVTDFGLPTALSSPFLAPEQVSGPLGVVGPLIDVYALGACAYSVVAGQNPFGAALGDELATKITREMPSALRALHPDVPADVERIIHRAMEKDPAKRYRSAALLAEDIDRWLQRKPPLQDVMMLEQLAREQLRAGRLEEAIHFLRDLKRKTKAEGPLVKLRDELIKQSGSDRMLAGDSDLLARGHARLLLSVVQHLTNQDPTEMAAGSILDFEKVLEMRGTSFEASLAHGVSLLLRARFPGNDDAATINLERAVVDFGEAAKSEGLRASALHNRAIARFYLFKRGRGEELGPQSIEDLKAAVAADPLYAFGWKDLGVIKLSRARADAVKTKMPRAVLAEVHRDLTRALDLCPDLDGALLERGKAAYGLRKYKDAIDDWLRAAKISGSRAKEVKPLIADAEVRAATRI